VKYFKTLSVTIIGIMFLQACNDLEPKVEPEVVIDDVPITIVDAAVSNGNFTTLVAALQATGLDATLSDVSNSFTVFAPTDDAFAKLPADTLENLTTEQLTNILLYHVLPGKVMSDGAITLAQSSSNITETANGGDIALSFSHSTLFVNGAKVSTADVMADNGVIHVINNVIMPVAEMGTPTDSIVDVAVADPDNFSTLVTALTAAGLVDTLADETKEFTVFAPTNAAFDNIDSDALDALLADTDALTAVLLTHVVGDATLTSLDAFAANGKTLTTLSTSTVDVGIDETTGLLIIGGANVVISDIYTTNGIIHVIDTVIIDE
jgi:transforming growth factor-beta-induced protein